jgi:hypothetical protein
MFGFGRKRKKDEENNGLSAPYVSSSPLVMPASPVVTPSSPVVMPSSGPAADPSAPPPGAPPSPAQVTFSSVSTTGTPANVPAMLSQILSGKGPVGELLKEIKSDPEAFRARIIAQAQAAGVSTYVMTPQGMTQVTGSSGATGVPGVPGMPGVPGVPGVPGAPGSQAHHVDVIDELTKAAALHDKGALTDAEFEALKKKLLGE